MPIISYLIVFAVGTLFGFIIPVFTINTLGEDSYLKPLLVEEQCAKYDETSGKFTIKNLKD